MAMTKVKNLQLWCKKMTDGYRDVDVKDMTSSWKNGLAFCALIHKFRPDLIDYDSLSKENVFENNQMAFDVAEKELNIPAFLDAADMVAIRVPDRLSVVTYVSQYYNNLHDKPQLGGPGVKKPVATKRHQDTEPAGPDAKRLTPSHDNAKTPAKERQVSMGDKCHICGDKVYLMERHVDKNKLYHRHCFRHSDLSPTNKVFNKSELKKINDKVKKENETNKQGKSEKDTQSQPDFWKRRNEARKVKKMEVDNSLSSKDVSNITENNVKPVPTKDVKTEEKGIKSDKKFSKDILSDKKDRPSDLNLDSKTEVKKSVDPKPPPRKHKTETVETMDTSEIESVKLKPVPTPRHVKDGEKHTSALNGFLSKKVDKTPDTSSSSFLTPHDKKLSSSSDISPLSPYNKKLSSSRDSSPLSPPPLPSQPPPSQLSKSDLSPRTESSSSSSITFSVSPRDTSKTSNLLDRKSPQFTTKMELSSPRSSPDSGGVVSPRNTRFSPTFSESSSSSDNSKFGSKITESKVLPKTNNKFTPTSSGHTTSNFIAQRASNFSPPSTKSALMDKRQLSVEEAIDLTKKSPESNETVAVVFMPSQKQQEESDKQVLGGLLSNLANIRRKQKLSETSPTDELVNQRHTTGVLDNQTKDNRGHVKSAIVTKHVEDRDQKKVKHFTDSESHSKETSKTKIDSDIPEWKKQLEKNKNLRPKSADLLSDKKDVNKTQKGTVISDKQVRPKTEDIKVPPRPKSVDLLSDKNKTDQKPQWQIEAEKRMEARKGGYVDPEKAKVIPSSQGDNQKPKDESKLVNPPIKPSRVDIKITDDKRESADVPRRILPPVPSHTDKAEDPGKKRISVNVKFDFSAGADRSKPEGLKPPRPPPLSPGSPKSISPGKPSRPPPPLKDGDFKRLSPFDIQKQLTEIDSRLTELEIRGRQLEDSIRKVQEEEDDKMMVEWFELVNNKNELVRKEADLIYLSRAQELEEEQHEIDRKLRELIQKDDQNKTEEDKLEEEQLIQKLLDVVNQRNIIVDSIDEDRIRYEEEDKDIALALQDFVKVGALTHDSGQVTVKSTEVSYAKKKKKKKGKLL